MKKYVIAFVIFAITIICFSFREGKNIKSTIKVEIENTYTTNIDYGEAGHFIIENKVLKATNARNEYGQLGNGELADPGIFHNHVIIAKNVKHFDYNLTSLVYLTEDGILYGCGNNNYGQLGHAIETGTEKCLNHKSDYILKPQIIMEEVKYAVLGNYHLLILKNDGSMWGLGYNKNGQLGIGVDKEKTYYCNPQWIMDDVLFIAAKDYNSAAITDKRELYVWGDNSQGQVGNGKSGNRFPTISNCISEKPEKVLEEVCSVYFFYDKNLNLKWKANN